MYHHFVFAIISCGTKQTMLCTGGPLAALVLHLVGNITSASLGDRIENFDIRFARKGSWR